MGKLVNDNLKATTGVYGIFFEGELLYVGMAQSLQKRFSNHSTNLKQGKHKNKYLQAIYDESEELTMKAIKYCDADEALELEHELINANSGLCNIRTMKGKVVKYSDESRQKMSASQRGSNNGNAKLSASQVGEILEKLKNGEKQDKLAKEYDIHPSYVSSINCNKKWKNLIHRFKGDGTREPKEIKVLSFTFDEETADIISKLKELGRVDLLWKI